MPRRTANIARTPKAQQDVAHHERIELNNMPAQMRTMLSHITRLQCLIPAEPLTGVTAEYTTSMTHDLYKAIGEANETLRAAIGVQEARKLDLFAKVVGSGTEWYQQCNLFVLHSGELQEILRMNPPKDAGIWAAYMRNALTFLETRMVTTTKAKPSPEELISLLGDSLRKENEFNISGSFCTKLTLLLAQFRSLPGGGVHALQMMMLIISEDWPHRIADFVEQPGSKKAVGGTLRNTVFRALQERRLWSSSPQEAPEQMQCQGGWLEDPKLAYWNYVPAYRQLWAAFAKYECKEQDCDARFYASGCGPFAVRRMPCFRKRSLGFVSLLQDRAEV
ncbi:hypothetical protein LTR86_007259 [Recurvomyces mirabilis]|nr:hypothetical protein LTR86_007259 [Recurvomyces mirabilis]